MTNADQTAARPAALVAGLADFLNRVFHPRSDVDHAALMRAYEAGRRHGYVAGRIDALSEAIIASQDAIRALAKKQRRPTWREHLRDWWIGDYDD